MIDSLNAPVRAEALLASLTDEQRAFAESAAPHLCCVAAAGSGKTAAVAARVVHLVRFRNVDPRRIRVFVFTRAARASIASRVESVLGGEVARMVDVTTFHGFACRVIGAAPASEETADAYLRSLYEGPTRVRGIPGITALREALVAHEAGTHAPEPDIARAMYRLLHRMEETASVPMWDALPRAEALLDGDADAMDRHAVSHVIVDEAQDVTPREERIARTVGGHVAAVGDPRQAIMGFRGAVGMCGVGVYAHDWHGDDCLPLSRSFRFGPNIAEFANRLMPQLGDAPIEPTVGDPEIDDVVREGATHDDAIRTLRGREPSAAVLCRTHDECDFAARHLSNLGLRVRYAGRAEPGEDRPDQFADAAAAGCAAVATIHAAKGREFDAVYVPSSEIEPRPVGDDAEVAYVAATRARRMLLWGDVRWAR